MRNLDDRLGYVSIEEKPDHTGVKNDPRKATVTLQRAMLRL